MLSHPSVIITLLGRITGAMGVGSSSTSPTCRARKGRQGDKPVIRKQEHGRWVKLQTSGPAPSPRSGHDVAIVNGKLYLFGGCGGEHEAINCLNDLYSFDLDLHKWEAVQIRGDVVPSARASFGMCTGPTPNTLIVAGGTGVEMDSLRSDVMEFDTRSRVWCKVTGGGDDAPSRFYGQTVCRYGDILLLFGGSTGLHYTNDLYEYNVRTNWWHKLQTTGTRPSPRYKHQSVVVGNCMYVLGGGCFKPEQRIIDLYCLNLLTLEWSTPAMAGEIPKARVAHSCSYDEETSCIYLWGGFTSELNRLDDFFCFNTITGEWSEIIAPQELSDSRPDKRAFHSAIFHNGALYIFSGANGDVRYNDVWRYQVRSTPPSLGVLAARAVLCTSCGVQEMMNVDISVPQEVLEGVLGMNEFASRLA